MEPRITRASAGLWGPGPSETDARQRERVFGGAGRDTPGLRGERGWDGGGGVVTQVGPTRPQAWSGP